MMKRALVLLLALATCGLAAPRRIVAMSPVVTELLYGIGAFDQVVGVSDFCTYPPATATLPHVGGWHNPSLEKLAALRPDLVIIDAGQKAFVEDRLRKMGLAVMSVPGQSLTDLYSAIDAHGLPVSRLRRGSERTNATP